jgi:hypothetical protein
VSLNKKSGDNYKDVSYIAGQVADILLWQIITRWISGPHSVTLRIFWDVKGKAVPVLN